MKLRIYNKNTGDFLNPEDYFLSFDGKIYKNDIFPEIISNQQDYLIEKSTGIIDSAGQEVFERDLIQIDSLHLATAAKLRMSEYLESAINDHNKFDVTYMNSNFDGSLFNQSFVIIALKNVKTPVPISVVYKCTILSTKECYGARSGRGRIRTIY